MRRLALLLLPGLFMAAALTAAPAKKASIGVVAPDLDAQLRKFKKVEMPFTFESLSARQRKEIEELIAASRDLENIYWRQSDP
ncbi:MAG TPA: hypothetical protein VHL58_03980, partial [Thermoanaerobaculia bacterium]|nr:hypothetical protein [Thermoanaerobaculia bacterium]